MAESQAIHAADSILDVVLKNGGQHLYDQYLQPKLKPFMVATVIQMFELYASNLDKGKDEEPSDKAVFDDLWTDDSEPVPAPPTSWVRERIRVRQTKKEPNYVIDDTISTFGKRTPSKKRLQKAFSMAVGQSIEGVFNIKNATSIM